MTLLAPRAPVLGLVVLAALVVLGGGAEAQESFRVTFEVDRTNPEQFVVTGTVVNESRVEVLDVSVTAEALDARGKRLARGIAYVSARIAPGASAPFTAKIPAVPGAARFRASVSSYRAAYGMPAAPQAP